MSTDAASPLRTWRDAQDPKVTLAELAARLGISEGQMSRIERAGTDKLTLATKLNEITNLPFEALSKSSSHSQAA